MTPKERAVIAGVLITVAAMVAIDLVTDFREGVASWHVVIEGLTGLVALLSAFYVLRGSVVLKHRLDRSLADSEAWRVEAKKYVEGLAQSIDRQLSRWNLSAAEKEVAFLLLKGFSLKEIAAIRKTSDKTARAQSMAVYAKSGLAGRSELAAFFLEDLLVPADQGPT